MEIKQCDFCRKPHQNPSSKLCRDCHIKLDEDFIKIKEYLYENEGAGIDEVSYETGVPRAIILHLLKDERLTVGKDDSDGGGFLTCETCKKPIRTGRMCADCKKEVISAVQQNVGPVVIKKKPEPVKEESLKGSAKINVK